MSCVRRYWTIIVRGLRMDFSYNLGMRIMIMSSLWALFETNLLIIFLISSIEKFNQRTEWQQCTSIINWWTVFHKERVKDFALFFEVSDKFVIVKKWWDTWIFLQLRYSAWHFAIAFLFLFIFLDRILNGLAKVIFNYLPIAAFSTCDQDRS